GGLVGRAFVLQAEDGRRGRSVTGVQTCALPIAARGRRPQDAREIYRGLSAVVGARAALTGRDQLDKLVQELLEKGVLYEEARREIGRASCREGGEGAAVGGEGEGGGGGQGGGGA